MTNTTATLILIGGKSKRINYKKQNTFIKNVTTQHIIQNTLHKIDVKNIFYSSKKKIQHPFFIQDILNNKSPLIGIYSAIYYFLKKTNFQNTLITAIDMPLLTKKILLILINTNNTYNGSYFEHTQFPLKIKITKKNLLIIKNLIKKNTYTIKKVITILQIKKIKNKKKNKLLFLNMNTPKIWYQINKTI